MYYERPAILGGGGIVLKGGVGQWQTFDVIRMHSGTRM